MSDAPMICHWQADTRTLHLRGALGAWRLRLWPAPTLDAVLAPTTGYAPPLHLDLAELPCVSAELAGLVAALRSVPLGVRRCVARFAPPHEQLFGLQLLDAVPEVRSLLEAVPSLGRALLATWRLAGDRAALSGCLRAERGRAQTRAVLRFLGLSDAMAMVKAVQKVRDPHRWTIHTLTDLDAWLRAAPKTVQHLPDLRRGQVAAWRAARDAGVGELLRPGFFTALPVPLADPVVAGLPGVFALLRRAGEDAPRIRRPVRSAAELGERVFAAISLQGGVVASVPPVGPDGGVLSPVHPPPWIRPLGTPAALAAEGQEMRHCLGQPAYLSDLREGRGYGYAVAHEAGRATAWVRPTERPGIVALVDLQGPEDVEPDPALRSAVQAWLDAHCAWAAHALHGGPVPTGSCVPVPDAARSFVRGHAGGVEDLLPVLLGIAAPEEEAPAPSAALDARPDPWWTLSLERALHENLHHLAQDAVLLREELAGLVHGLRGLTAPGPDEQDAILLDFARCAVLFEQALATEAGDLADLVEAGIDPPTP
jgi:hypothetical protein